MAEEKEKKKKSKKGLIIALLLIIVIIAVAVAVVVLMNGSSDEEKAEEEKTTGVEWGDNYYVYLLEDYENSVSTLLDDDEELESIKVSFVELEDFDAPIMIVEGLLEDNALVTFGYIEDDEVKCTSSYANESEIQGVEYLYNVETEEYNWYVYIENNEENEEDKYILVDEFIENNGYYFSNSESEIDGKVVETGITAEAIEANLGDEEKIFTAMETSVNSYQTNEELLTDDIIEEVETKAEEIKEEQAKAEKLEAAILTNSNVQEKIYDHMHYFISAYLGTDYGIGHIYPKKEVTGTVTIPGVDEYLMVYELEGLGSIAEIKENLRKYMTNDVIEEIENSGVDLEQYLYEYNGKVYWVSGGIGDGPSINIEDAEVLSSENGVSKVQLKEVYTYDVEVVSAVLTLTVEYDEDTDTYMITDLSIQNSY